MAIFGDTPLKSLPLADDSIDERSTRGSSVADFIPRGIRNLIVHMLDECSFP